MKTTTDDFLINKLKEGNNLNITLLSNSEYLPEVQNLAEHFANCNVVTFDPYDYFINNIRLIECRCTDDALKNSIIKTKSNKNYFSYAKKKLGLDFERKVVLGGLKI